MKSVIGVLLLIMLAAPALANWRLDNADSRLHFISTKNQNFSEIHRFTQLKGKLDQKGYLTVTVLLSSVDTGIGIRDTRMKEMLFNTAQIPFAKLKTQLDETVFDLENGESADFVFDAVILMNGAEKAHTFDVRVTQLPGGKLRANTLKPLLLSASDYNLTEGVNKLREIAGLQSIGLTVPVTFDVTFTPIN